jgi:homoserine O-acetyltransferase/O-succinyltransferase
MLFTTKIYTHNKTFNLEGNRSIPSFHLTYTTYGKMNADKSNVV